MKVQAHNNELRPLFRENFDKVYDAIVKILPAEEVIFAKRSAGFGDIIQWSLPTDAQWQPLTLADSLDRQAVIDAFMRHKAAGEAKLGRNKKLIEAIYSVPSEAHVYYAIAPDNSYRVMLTGWGYTYPYQAPETLLSHLSGEDMREVNVKFIESGNAVAGLRFEIMRAAGRSVSHTTDAEGAFHLGQLPVGTQLQINVPSAGRNFTLAVTADRSIYTFDITPEPAVTPPPFVQPEPEPEPEPAPEEETPIEMVFPPRRDISVRFVDSSTGKPVTDREVVFSATGRTAVSCTLDEQGVAYLSNEDFPQLTPIRVEMPSQTDYPPFDMQLEPDETQYEIIFGQSGNAPRWKEILFAVAGAVVASGSFYLLLHYGFEIL